MADRRRSHDPHGRLQLGDEMQERIARLDDALIDHVFQPIVNTLAARTAVDCFYLARLCNDAAALAWILSQLGCMSDALASGNMAFIGAEGTLIIIGLAALTTLRRVFDGRHGPRSSTGGRGNPLRPAMFLHRLCCLLGLGVQLFSNLTRPSGVAEALIIAVSLMTTASVYIGACSSPPPERRRQVNRHRTPRLAAFRCS